MNWLDEDFEEDEVLALLAVKLPFLGDASFERALACPVSPEHIYIMRDDLGEVTDLSGLRVEQRLIAYLMTADEAAQTTYFGK